MKRETRLRLFKYDENALEADKEGKVGETSSDNAFQRTFSNGRGIWSSGLSMEEIAVGLLPLESELQKAVSNLKFGDNNFTVMGVFQQLAKIGQGKEGGYAWQLCPDFHPAAGRNLQINLMHRYIDDELNVHCYLSSFHFYYYYCPMDPKWLAMQRHAPKDIGERYSRYNAIFTKGAYEIGALFLEFFAKVLTVNNILPDFTALLPYLTEKFDAHLAPMKIFRAGGNTYEILLDKVVEDHIVQCVEVFDEKVWNFERAAAVHKYLESCAIVEVERSRVDSHIQGDIDNLFSLIPQTKDRSNIDHFFDGFIWGDLQRRDLDIKFLMQHISILRKRVMTDDQNNLLLMLEKRLVQMSPGAIEGLPTLLCIIDCLFRTRQKAYTKKEEWLTECYFIASDLESRGIDYPKNLQNQIDQLDKSVKFISGAMRRFPNIIKLSPPAMVNALLLSVYMEEPEFVAYAYSIKKALYDVNKNAGDYDKEEEQRLAAALALMLSKKDIGTAIGRLMVVVNHITSEKDVNGSRFNR